MEKFQRIKTIGLIIILISLILSIGAITVSGIDFQVLNVNWNNSPWRHLGVLQLISTIYTSVVSIIGIIIFTALYNKNVFIIIVNYNLNYYSILYFLYYQYFFLLQLEFLMQ